MIPLSLNNPLRVKKAENIIIRFWGLMGTRKWPAGYDALWFPQCSAVHTFFTFCRPDLLFLDREYRVLSIHPQTAPWKIILGPMRCFGCLEIGSGEAGKRNWRVGTDLSNIFRQVPET